MSYKSSSFDEIDLQDWLRPNNTKLLHAINNARSEHNMNDYRFRQNKYNSDATFVYCTTRESRVVITIEEIFILEGTSNLEISNTWENLVNCNKLMTETLNKVNKLRSGLLYFTESSFYVLDNTYITQFENKIIKSKVLKPYNGSLGSLIIVILQGGKICTYFPPSYHKTAMKIQEFDIGFDGDFEIREHVSGKYFLIYERNTGILFRFKLGTKFLYQKLANVDFPNNGVEFSDFFPDWHNNSSIQYQLIISNSPLGVCYYCLEWDENDLDDPEIHQLSHKVDSEYICAVPVGKDRILICYRKFCHILSSKQIISGDTNFQYEMDLKAFGYAITYFSDNELLSRLKSFDSNQFAKLEQCTIVYCCDTGEVSLILYGESFRIKILHLSTYRGSCQVIKYPWLSYEATSYAILLQTCSALKIIEYDVKQIIAGITKTNINLISPIISKRTLAQNDVKKTSVSLVTTEDYNGNIDSELWVTEGRKLYRLSKSSLCCHIREKNKFKEFQDYDTVKPVEFLNWKKASISGMNIEPHRCLFFIASKPKIAADIFMITPYTEGWKISRLDITLHASNNFTQRFIFCNNDSFIHVSERSVDINAHEIWRRHNFSFSISDSIVSHQAILVWNSDLSEVHYLSDIYDSSKLFVRWRIFEGSLERQLLNTGIVFSLDMVDHNGMLKLQVLLNNKCYEIVLNDKNQARSLTCTAILDSSTLVSYQYSPVGGNIMIGMLHELLFHQKDVKLIKITTRIKHFEGSRYIAFDKRSAYLIDFIWPNTIQHLSEIMLPHKKTVPLIDVSLYNIHEQLILVANFCNDLHMMVISHFNGIQESLPLKLKTSSMNTQLIYLKRISRMLVVYKSEKKWELVNLTNGKSSVLDQTTLEFANEKLNALVKIEDSNIGNGTTIWFLIIFETCAKYVELKPSKGAIGVKLLDTINFGGILRHISNTSKESNCIAFNLLREYGHVLMIVETTEKAAKIKKIEEIPYIADTLFFCSEDLFIVNRTQCVVFPAYHMDGNNIVKVRASLPGRQIMHSLAINTNVILLIVQRDVMSFWKSTYSELQFFKRDLWHNQFEEMAPYLCIDLEFQVVDFLYNEEIGVLYLRSRTNEWHIYKELT